MIQKDWDDLQILKIQKAVLGPSGSLDDLANFSNTNNNSEYFWSNRNDKHLIWDPFNKDQNGMYRALLTCEWIFFVGREVVKWIKLQLKKKNLNFFFSFKN